jgi:mannitol operon transcriptional antiterminator
MIRNIEQMGPYIVLAQGFALPHEAPDMGGKKLGMNLIRLKEPVSFHSQFYDPVEFVCTLSTIDKDSHLKAMFHLMNLLSKVDFCENIRKVKTAEEIYQIIYEYEAIL